VAAGPDGVFTVAWRSAADNLVARNFGVSGKPSGDIFPVSAEGAHSPSMAYTSQGVLVIAWEQAADNDRASIFARRFTRAGEPLGDAWQVNEDTGHGQSRANLAIGPNDEILVGWSGKDASGWDVFGRLYDPTGIPIGPEFRVNRYTYGDQFTSHFCGQSSTAIHGSTLLFAWTGQGPQDNEGIFLTRFVE
jgi:hypothetical protein